MPKRSSVRNKLFFAIFGPSVLVLAIVGALWMYYDAQALRSSIERETSVQASVIARASVGLIGINDDLVLHELLAALKAEPDIILAVIYLSDGEPFVQYNPLGRPIPPFPEAGERGNILAVVRDITSGEEVVGRLLIQASLDAYYQRLWWYTLEAAGVLILLVFVAALAANALRARLLAPLENLAATARTISEKKDYSVRAKGFEDAEFQTVTAAFNQMLQEIEQQNSALSAANAELRAANRELEAFTYSVSHDLRTPLRAISSYAQILRISEELSTTHTQEFLQRIEKNAVKMAGLIDDLLAFSRIDTHPLERREIDLTEIAARAWEEIAGDNMDRQIEFQLEPLGVVSGDPALLHQVLTNLLSNAVKYTRRESTAKIAVGRLQSAAEATYYVRDNGVGFSMKHASKLFGVFQRMHSEAEFEGTGVGLAIVHRIITRHNGRIWVEAHPGEGACFYFTLSQ